MTDANSAIDCPDPETLAAFAEGAVPRAEAAAIAAHLDMCPVCTEIVAAVGAQAGEPPAARSQAWWLGLAAAAVLAVVATAVVWQRTQESPVSRLAAMVEGEPRLFATRIGELPYARLQGRARSEDAAGDARRMKLVGAAGELVEVAEQTKTAEAQHHAGVALLLVDRPDDALTRLRTAAEGAPERAVFWSDLAAAQYAAAEKNGRPSLYPEALASCDRALDLEPGLPAALFNRALVLERLGLRHEARAAWQKFLEADASSEWAVEARQHLADLPEQSGESLFRRDWPRIESAAAANDRRQLAGLVERDPQRSRTFAESESLGEWADAILAGDDARAARALAVARGVGDALVRQSGESLLHETVRSIDAAGAARRRTLAASHAGYRRGRIALSRRMPEKAYPELVRAAEGLAGEPMELLARYYAANALFERNDLGGARRELERVREAADAHPRFIAIGAQIRNQLAVCAIADLDWAAAAEWSQEAMSRFHRLGERANEGFAAAVAASALLGSGRSEDAWAARIRALTLLDAERNAQRLAVSLGEAVRTELGAGRLHQARALLRVETATTRTGGDDVLLSYALVRSAVIESRPGNDDAALRLAREAESVAARVADPAMRARALADASFALGAVTLPADPRGAEERLTAALSHYETTGRWLFVPESLLLRARARLRLGRDEDAEADLRDGIALLERYPRDRAGAIAGTGAFDADDALFEEAIRLRAARGDAEGVFAYAERSRSRSGDAPVPALQELRQRLGGSAAAILELIALPGEVVALSVTGGDTRLARTKVELSRIDALAAAARAGDDGASRELFELLIRPAWPDVAGARELIVVADAPLRAVPFSSLLDARSGRYLIEQFPVAIAPSAALLDVRAEQSPPSTIATLAVESGGAGGLPGADAELADVARRYPRALGVTPSIAGIVEAAHSADVLHFAGHTQRQARTGDAVLLVAGRAISGEVLAGTSLGKPVTVVLAACETLRAARQAQARPLSLGDGFLAAGAADVIGTLSAVRDQDASRLFRAIHEQLAGGAPAPVAVRRAQLDAISRNDDSAWRSIATLTRRIPSDT